MTRGSYCLDDSRRRRAIRSSRLNGLDYVEVEPSQTTLSVNFLGRAPEGIEPANVFIEGPPDQPAVKVLDVAMKEGGGEIDDRMIVGVDRPGGFGEYRLCIAKLDRRGRPAGPPDNFDPRYSCASFDFKANCPTGRDCLVQCSCDAPAEPAPDIDYTAKDFSSFRQLMLDRMAITLPQWKERREPDIGIMLVELVAYVADGLSYYQDAVATEAYLNTARRRISIRRHLRLVDYRLHEGAAARTWAVLEVKGGDLKIDPKNLFFTSPVEGISATAVGQDEFAKTNPQGYLQFETAGEETISVRECRNEIHFYRWGRRGCCLPAGSTSATLIDPGFSASRRDQPRHVLDLRAGEILLFEEHLGPRTGAPADADPTKRQAVRLTRATPIEDKFQHQLLWEIEWCANDALTFPLCLDSIVDPPDCEWLQDVSVAHANVILVSAGASRQDKPVVVPEGETESKCATDCDEDEETKKPDRFGPCLQWPGVAHGNPLPTGSSCRENAASLLLATDAATAVAEVYLLSVAAGSDDAPRRWTAVPDLLSSGPDDFHFVVEVDDEERACLRFGDDRNGRAPEAGESFTAYYRVGNGLGTNAGAGALGLIVFRSAFPDGVTLSVSNPVPASGGINPEDVRHARLAGPEQYKTKLERAITPDDYSAIVLRDFAHKVQGASASLRTSGAASEVQIFIDPFASEEGDKALLGEIREHLEQYRSIDHDVRVLGARRIPLAIALTICVKPSYRQEPVTAAVRAALGPCGLLSDDLTSFGATISASRLIAAAQSVDGVASAIVTRLERAREGDNGELDAGYLTLGPQEVPLVADDQRFADEGSLKLVMRGGL